MPAFNLRHATTYGFAAPVTLQPHQLYLRPRGDHKLKIKASTLTLSPTAEVVWRNDLYGNSVAIAHFTGKTTRLDIISELDVETFPRSESQRRLLLQSGTAEYSPTERRLLAPYITQPWDTGHAAAEWIRKGASKVKKSQYERLLECAARIRYEFDYRIRYEPGLQSPAETLSLHSGTCRDFAELMIAACLGRDLPACAGLDRARRHQRAGRRWRLDPHRVGRQRRRPDADLGRFYRADHECNHVGRRGRDEVRLTASVWP
jgi:transglutaminase-like putative cysteine protease